MMIFNPHMFAYKFPRERRITVPFFDNSKVVWEFNRSKGMSEEEGLRGCMAVWMVLAREVYVITQGSLKLPPLIGYRHLSIVYNT